MKLQKKYWNNWSKYLRSVHAHAVRCVIWSGLYHYFSDYLLKYLIRLYLTLNYTKFFIRISISFLFVFNKLLSYILLTIARNHESLIFNGYIVMGMISVVLTFIARKIEILKLNRDFWESPLIVYILISILPIGVCPIKNNNICFDYLH